MLKNIVGRYFKKNSSEKKDNSYLFKNGKINIKKIKSILILKYNCSLEDVILSTAFFKEVKKYNSNIKIGVVANETPLDLIKNNKDINNIHEYKKGLEDYLASEIDKINYDILIDFRESLTYDEAEFVRKCRGKISIGMDEKRTNLLDISFKKDEDKSMLNIYKDALEIIGIHDTKLETELKIRENDKVRRKFTERLVLINPFGEGPLGSLTNERIVGIGKEILKLENTKVVLIGQNVQEKREVFNELGLENIIYAEIKNISNMLGWLDKSDIIISVDSVLVHLAEALKKPMIAIYRQDTGDNRPILWGANFDKTIQIYSHDYRGIGRESDINLFILEQLKESLTYISKRKK